LEPYTIVTAATYTAKAGDRLIGVNRSGAVTITLPSDQLIAGRTCTIKDESGSASANNITLATEGSETIDGSATDTISEDYGSKTYYSDGSNWFSVPLPAVGSHSLASHSSEAHSDLTSVGTDDHHPESHTVASHSDTTTTRAELETLTDGSETSLHSHLGGNPHQFIKKTSDESVTSSTSLQNDDDFVFAVAANNVWLVEIFGYVTNMDTGGMKTGWSLPSSATMLNNIVMWGGAARTDCASMAAAGQTGTGLGASNGSLAAIAGFHLMTMIKSVPPL
jgi:hypothetical protein